MNTLRNVLIMLAATAACSEVSFAQCALKGTQERLQIYKYAFNCDVQTYAREFCQDEYGSPGYAYMEIYQTLYDDMFGEVMFDDNRDFGSEIWTHFDMPGYLRHCYRAEAHFYMEDPETGVVWLDDSMSSSDCCDYALGT